MIVSFFACFAHMFANVCQCFLTICHFFAPMLISRNFMFRRFHVHINILKPDPQTKYQRCLNASEKPFGGVRINSDS